MVGPASQCPHGLNLVVDPARINIQASSSVKPKFGEWAILGPWLPKGWLKWDGSLPVRILRPEVAALTSEGVKRSKGIFYPLSSKDPHTER